MIVLILILSSFMDLYAADALYRFMHNDHDALVIARIIEYDSDIAKIDVKETISSSKDLNTLRPKKQLSIRQAEVSALHKYGFYDENNDDSSPCIGDYVLLSLNKT